MAAATWFAPISPVSGSTSANTTSAPVRRTALAVARNVIAGTTAASPGPSPTLMAARWSAAVPLEQATASGAFTASASARSKAVTAGPVVRNSPRSTASTAAMSSSSTQCRP